MTARQSIALSLISHTNVGKTTLARTLLGRDIGEVRDEAHVTLEAERHVLVDTAQGDRLELWDTPGLGDSVRLARRLEQHRNPLGWFLSEVWDRFRDRAFWSSQRAVRNILEQADVVLYLVNASEAPEDIGYLDAELRVLELIGKPVVALLNQMGPPSPPSQEAAEVERWRARIGASRGVTRVLAFDAFARCWVQEDTLLAAVGDALDADKQTGKGVRFARHDAFERLRAAWQLRNRERFDASMRSLAAGLLQTAADVEVVDERGWTGRVATAGREIGHKLGSLLGLRREDTDTPRARAMEALARRLDERIRASTAELIRLHSLEGEATGVVLARVAEHYAERTPVSEGKAAVLGGMLTGALAGLKADLASGGLTLGGGLLAGGVIGALGAAGLTRGFNLVRGVDRPVITWSNDVLLQLTRSALLTYLAVAHYGRGRGAWSEGEHPAFWTRLVDDAVERHAKDVVRALDRDRAARPGSLPEEQRDQQLAALAERLGEMTRELLAVMYPAAFPR